MKVYNANGEEKTGLVVARDQSSFRHTGTYHEIWYFSGVVNNTAGTTLTVSANVLYATPFISPARGGTLDTLAVAITTGVAGNMRFGLYKNIHPSILWPWTLLEDSGAKSTGSVAVVQHSISRKLDPGQLYWIAAVFDVAPGIRAMSIGGMTNVLGVTSALGTTQNSYITHTFTYAALPDPFPVSTPVVATGIAPAFAAKFSA